MKKISALLLLFAMLINSMCCFADELVSMTIPSFDGVPVATQEELDASNGEWYESAVLNEDGSITYRLTKENRNMAIESLVAGIDEDLYKMIGSEDYPNFVSIERNNDFTKYTITTTSEELDLNELFSSLLFLFDSAMYHGMNDTVPDDVVITYVNAESDIVIHEVKLSEMGE